MTPWLKIKKAWICSSVWRLQVQSSILGDISMTQAPYICQSHPDSLDSIQGPGSGREVGTWTEAQVSLGAACSKLYSQQGSRRPLPRKVVEGNWSPTSSSSIDSRIRNITKHLSDAFHPPQLLETLTLQPLPNSAGFLEPSPLGALFENTPPSTDPSSPKPLPPAALSSSRTRSQPLAAWRRRSRALFRELANIGTA